MTSPLRAFLLMPFWFDSERLTDSRLESILKRADGKLTHLSIQTTLEYGIAIDPPLRLLSPRTSVPFTRKMIADIPWRAPLFPNIMPLILHASRKRRLNYLDIQGLEVRDFYPGFKKKKKKKFFDLLQWITTWCTLILTCMLLIFLWILMWVTKTQNVVHGFQWKILVKALLESRMRIEWYFCFGGAH